MTAATIVVDCLVVKTTYWGCFNANKQNHNTTYEGTAAFGLPKYWSYALLLMKDGTHDM